MGTDGKSALRRAYNAAPFRDLNATSMALYSGPPPDGSRGGWAEGRYETASPLAIVARPEVAWLASGDAPLGSAKSAREFSGAFRAFSAGVATFVLPHHGSDFSFHKELLAPFPKGTAFVASADCYSTWTHPGPEATRASLLAGHLIWVRADEATRWTEHLLASRA